MRATVLGGIVLVFLLGGCASTGSRNLADLTLQVDALKNEVAVLKQQVGEQNKMGFAGPGEQDTLSLDGFDYGAAEQAPSLADTPMTTKNIQRALKSAGFYNGSIDGKVGKQTRKAIREFQTANRLVSDGKVGKKTWSKLQQYLK